MYLVLHFFCVAVWRYMLTGGLPMRTTRICSPRFLFLHIFFLVITCIYEHNFLNCSVHFFFKKKHFALWKSRGVQGRA